MISTPPQDIFLLGGEGRGGLRLLRAQTREQGPPLAYANITFLIYIISKLNLYVIRKPNVK